jgi:hypothetical protein
MTIAAIWEAVRESGGEVNSADPLAEITAVLTSLRNSAYPFERIGRTRQMERRATRCGLALGALAPHPARSRGRPQD